MKRAIRMLSSAFAVAVLLMSLFGGIASADPGDQGLNVDAQGQDDGGALPALDDLILPEDPGIQ
jgi:hypothetical protein